MRRTATIGLCVLALATAANAAVEARDGSHDFDFDVGHWRTHAWRRERPLTGSTDWAEMDGTTIVRPILEGRGNLAEVRLAGATRTIDLIALRRYDANARQWTIDFATPDVGTPGVPAIGEFRNGRGDFYDQESIGGHAVLVRFSIWPVTGDVVESEQAFSEDGGRTWELNWRSHYTRIVD